MRPRQPARGSRAVRVWCLLPLVALVAVQVLPEARCDFGGALLDSLTFEGEGDGAPPEQRMEDLLTWAIGKAAPAPLVGRKSCGLGGLVSTRACCAGT